MDLLVEMVERMIMESINSLEVVLPLLASLISERTKRSRRSLERTQIALTSSSHKF